MFVRIDLQPWFVAAYPTNKLARGKRETTDDSFSMSISLPLPDTLTLHHFPTPSPPPPPLSLCLSLFVGSTVWDSRLKNKIDETY